MSGAQHDGAPVSLSFDPDILLREVTLTLLRQPERSRELDGALAMLQRLRARGKDAAPHSSAPTLAGEMRQLEGMDAVLKSVAAEDERTIAQRSFGPSDIGAVEQLMRERVHRGGGGRIENFRTLVVGYSKQTSLFDWVDDEGVTTGYVMRRDNPLKIVPSVVTDEYPLLVALHRCGQPVAEPILSETDHPLIPEPFIVTRRIAGQSMGSPLGLDAGEGFDPRPYLAEMLAGLHGLAPARLRVPRFSDRPFDSDMLLAQIAFWRDLYLADRQVAAPAIDAAIALLEADVDVGLSPGVIVHGDPGFYNLLLDDGRLTGVVDWELAHLGGAAWDLTYVKDTVEKLGPFDDFLTLYESHGGVRPTPVVLAYYNLLRLLFAATLCVRGLAKFNRGEPLGLDLLHVLCTMYPHYVEEIAKAIDAYEAQRAAL